MPADTELPENDAFPKWDSLSETEQRLYARQMEVYAGYSENADWNVGRVLAAIEEMGELDNTLVIWIWGDNGASMEGTLSGTFNELTTLNGIPLTTEQQMGLLFKHGGLEAWGGDLMAPHYSSAWAWASNCPFDWGKQVASHLGGTRNPLVIRYPKRDLRPGRNAQPLHARDRRRADGARDRRHPGARRTWTGSSRSRCTASPSPTRSPTRARPSGTRSSTSRRSATGRCTRTAGGSRCACRASRGCSTPRRCASFGPGWDPDADPVELYYLPDDFAQAKNLADEHPEKVEELRKLFWEEAERYQVLPILGGLSSFYGIVPPIPKESKFTYRGRIENVAAGMIPRIYNHSYTISADIVVPEGGAEGVIVAAFDHLGGFALYVQDGKLKHHYSMLGVLEYTQEAETPLPAGEVSVEMVFAADEPKPATGGEVTLLVNGEPVASGRMEHTVPARFSGYAGMDIGCDNGLVVDRSYADKAPFRFTGEIKQVTFDIAPHMSEEDQQALHEHAAQALAAHGGERLGTRRMKHERQEQLDVLIAVYLIPDLAQAGLRRVRGARRGEGRSSTDGVVLVSKDAEGEVHGRGDRRPPRCARAPRSEAESVSSSASSRRRSSRRRPSEPAAGGLAREVRQEAGRDRDRREDGRRAARRLGGADRDLRPRRRRHRRRGARRTRSGRRWHRSTRRARRSSRPGSRRPRPGSEVEVSRDGADRGFVVVTGTSTGIGAATALHLADEGLPRLRGRAAGGRRRGVASAGSGDG